MIMASNRNVSLLLIIMFMSQSFKNGVEGRQRVFMTVRNDLMTNLTLGCHSSEDSLGTKILETNKTLDFNFKPNIWGSTKFVCNFVWLNNGAYVIHNNYLIYAYDPDYKLCGHRCLLAIAQDKITQYDAQNILVHVYSW
jgi:hypothetical protein